MESRRLLGALLLLQASVAFRIYQDRVPNGDHVPHPCKPNFLWRGVGHMNPLGGGDRNKFGEDYGRTKQWTSELCRMDSDNDGLTNGQELGDPDCVWTPGNLPARITGITHPGVCDPWGDAKCQEANKDISCSTGEFKCDDIHSEDVFNITLRFPPTSVPAKETTYMCFTFELSMLEPDVEYHMIATQPFTDNANVMHHTTIAGCDATSVAMEKPAECNMGSTGCQSTLSVWTLGMPGECVYKEAGFVIGRNGYTRLNMQHHWTNPELNTNYVDSSGMILYLTKKLRKYNAGYFSVGQYHLVIPPGQDRVVETSLCSEECTRKNMNGSVYLMNGWNHMHYLGYQQNVEHYRNGEKLRDLTPDEIYSYDNPIVHEYNPLVELRAGDSLKTTCVYRSTSRKKTTEFGEGSFDEMCFGVFTYFPAENMKSFCLTWDDVEICQFEGSKLYGCDYGMLFNKTDPARVELVSKVMDNCSPYGGCRAECPAALAEVRAHPCFNDRLMSFTASTIDTYASHEDVKFLAAMRSCECSADTRPPIYPTNGGPGMPANTGMVLLLLGLAYLTMSCSCV